MKRYYRWHAGRVQARLGRQPPVVERRWSGMPLWYCCGYVPILNVRSYSRSRHRRDANPHPCGAVTLRMKRCYRWHAGRVQARLGRQPPVVESRWSGMQLWYCCGYVPILSVQLRRKKMRRSHLRWDANPRPCGAVTMRAKRCCRCSRDDSRCHHCHHLHCGACCPQWRGCNDLGEGKKFKSVALKSTFISSSKLCSKDTKLERDLIFFYLFHTNDQSGARVGVLEHLTRSS